MVRVACRVSRGLWWRMAFTMFEPSTQNATDAQCDEYFAPKLPAEIAFWGLVLAGAMFVAVIVIFILLETLGRCKMYRAQAFVANVFVVLPANVLLISAYFILTPFRLIYYRCMNQCMTAIVSIGTSRPSFWKADYNTLLRAFPVGYRAILGGRNPLEMDYGECADVMRESMQEFPMPCLRRCIGSCRCCSPDVVNSFAWRMFMNVTLLPCLSWWLIGFVFIPFVELGEEREILLDQQYEGRTLSLITKSPTGKVLIHDTCEEDSEAGAQLHSRQRARAVQRNRAAWIRGRLKQSAEASEMNEQLASIKISRKSINESASVRMYIPRCKFLVNARKLYGKSQGDRACKNE